jgi:hypothetical protein
MLNLLIGYRIALSGLDSIFSRNSRIVTDNFQADPASKTLRRGLRRLAGQQSGILTIKAFSSKIEAGSP